MKYIKRGLFFFPVLIFVFIATIFYSALKYGTIDELPSNLLQKTAPKLKLDTLGKKDYPTNSDLTSPEIKFVNFWASWCAPCRAEHPLLKQIAELNYPIIGINYKDDPQNALKFLEELGDPFKKVGADPSGRNGLEWGLYGVPETFILNQRGEIILRHAGPITSTIFKNKFKPVLNKSP